MINRLAVFFGFAKIVRFSPNIEIIRELLPLKTLYVNKFGHPRLTSAIRGIYTVHSNTNIDIPYVDLRGGPMCLDFFNEIFYYEWIL